MTTALLHSNQTVKLGQTSVRDGGGDFVSNEKLILTDANVEEIEEKKDVHGPYVDEEESIGKKKPVSSSSLIDQCYSQLSLELSNRCLDQIPNTIFNHSQNIKIIYLQDNRIGEMPDNFFDHLPYLAWCDLRFNQIQHLPNFSKPHNSLRVLMLQDNRLMSLPYSLGIHAVKLKTLGLRGNPLHDPPQDVLDAGPQAIRLYLIDSSKHDGVGRACNLVDSVECGGQRSETRQSTVSEGKNGRMRGKKKSTCCTTSPRMSIKNFNKDVPNFAKSLYNSLARAKARKSQSVVVGSRKMSRLGHQSLSLFGPVDVKTASNITYTNDLWRDIPYDGFSQKELINNSLEEMRCQIMRKFSIQRDKIIQRIKDREVLAKWRFETRDLQKAGRRPGTCALVIPPYGVTTDIVQQDVESHLSHSLQYVQMDPETFQKQVTECSKKLQHFIENPTSITDSEAAFRRLQEVEEIQRKLCSMKLSIKCPTPI